jgi:hypothetical protein
MSGKWMVRSLPLRDHSRASSPRRTIMARLVVLRLVLRPADQVVRARDLLDRAGQDNIDRPGQAGRIRTAPSVRRPAGLTTAPGPCAAPAERDRRACGVVPAVRQTSRRPRVPLVQAAAPADLAVNGSFEAGSVSPWTQYPADLVVLRTKRQRTYSSGQPSRRCFVAAVP